MGRDELCLNGEWDFMPVYGSKSCLDLPEIIVYEKEKIRVPSSWRYVTPEKSPYDDKGFGVVGDFQPYNMFGYPQEWSSADTGVYHRSFKTPVNMLNGRVFLRFDGIIQRARIILNGNMVADWSESYLPLKVDVTGFIKRDGTDNELVVICTTFEEVTIFSGVKKQLGLGGSWYSSIGRGIWQDVYLQYQPDIYIDDVFIRTSVRNNTIEVDISVCNKTVSARETEVQVIIYGSDTVAKDMGKTNIKIAAYSIKDINIKDFWHAPHFWTIDDPYLHYMQVVLLEEGAEVDRKTVRFGFREVWAEAFKFLLNGTRINLRGDSWHFQGSIQQTKEYALNWFRMCKENGLNFVRLHAEPYPEYYLEAADEAGMLIIDETAIYGSAKSMPADNPVYLDMCKKHVERLVERDRNHPSVVVWSLQNEMRWVDGRDAYKRHIPEMMQIIRELDGTRLIILEGDNRLISKENTEIESYHYNIDGTIAQWDKQHPLVYGEHGGWWYNCPQNSSAYTGLGAYLDYDGSSQGVAVKEKLYVEYARKSDVSGITSFNFAHYMMKSMPDEDIYLNWESLETPGCKPEVIRKHSLTINNGYLKNYPVYKPNVSMDILKEAYKPVTIIPSEYNTSFFDGSHINRSFDVYNDTLYTQKCSVVFTIRQNCSEVYKEVFEFIQEPGERKNLNISFLPHKADKMTILTLEAALTHDSHERHRLFKAYKLYPEGLKNSPINIFGKSIAYYGEGCSRSILENLIQNCVEIHDLRELESRHFDIVIIGSYVDNHADEYQEAIKSFVENGGVLVQLEQFKFVPGDLTLVKQPFFSAHINNPHHKILEGLNDDDFIFWNGGTKEETPCSLIEQCFIKPVKGDADMLLECSAGDFGDGGDLWTPLIEYKFRKGAMLLNQLEIIDNYDSVPQACLLLRNIISHAVGLQPGKQSPTALLADAESQLSLFIRKLGLVFDNIGANDDFSIYETILTDMDAVTDKISEKLKCFASEGGNVIIFPLEINQEAAIQELLSCPAVIHNTPTYHLKKVVSDRLTDSISIVDLFRYEKVPLTPRNVENIPICENTIEIGGAENLLVSVNGTPWHDYFVRNHSCEYSRVALADMNRTYKKADLPYLVRKRYGKGSFIISQLSIDWKNEKNIRSYSRLLSNSGVFIQGDIFSYHKGERDFAVDYFMTLPHRGYNDYRKAEAYYSDKEYSLNNLGEGLYGWMKKVEKNTSDGFINITGSSGQTYFLTCFVDYIRDKCKNIEQPEVLKCKLQLDINCSFKLWINGMLLKDYTKEGGGIVSVLIDGTLLVKGLNRLIIVCRASDEDIGLRPVFKLPDGGFPDNIKYQLTIDEVDPK